MKIIVTGIFDTVSAASTAVSRLVAQGHDQAGISLVVPDEQEHQAATAAISEDKGIQVVERTEAGTRRGMSLGAIVGASGMALGATILLPGLLAIGPLAALLVGAGSGALSGGLLGGLMGIGVSRDLAEVYHRSLEGGAAMIGVDAPLEKHAAVRATLLECGARSLSDVSFR